MKRGGFLVAFALTALVFSGLAAAALGPLDIVIGTSVSPTSTLEQRPTGFSVAVVNNLESTESICHVNIVTSNFTVTDVTDKVNWTSYITPFGVYWNTSTSCMSNDAGGTFRFEAQSVPLASNITSTWEVDVANLGMDDTNFTTLTVDVYRDDSAPSVVLVSPLVNSSINQTFTCNVSDNAWLKNVTFYWNLTGSWLPDETAIAGGDFSTAEFDRTDLPEEASLEWNCLACDVNDNCAFAPANAAVTVLDLVPPTITVVSPLEYYYNTSSVWFNLTLNDNGSWCGYDIGAGNVTLSKLDDFTFYGFDPAVADGQHTAVFYCNDTAGNMNSTSVQFAVDTTPPVAELGVNPIDYYNSSGQTLAFEMVCHDSLAGADYAELWGDWPGSWQKIQGNLSYVNGTVWTASVPGVPEGTWTWGAFCEDSVRNTDWSDQNRTFTVDITFPQVWFEDPTPLLNWSEQTGTSVTVNVSYTELYPDTVLLNWNGADEVMSSPSVTKPGLPDGEYTFYVWMNDSAGNSNQTESRTVVVDTTAPEVYFTAPTPANNSVLSGDSITIGVFHQDRSLGTLILNWDGGNSTQSFSAGNQTNITVSVSDGQHSFYVWVSDTLGNSNSTETRFITVDNTPPSGPSGWSGTDTGTGFFGGGGTPPCEENWICSNWTACSGGSQQRNCTDLNECGTATDKPAETRGCTLPAPEPKEVICTPGDIMCSGESVVECSSDGTEWGFVKNCLHGCLDGQCLGDPRESPGASITGQILSATSSIAAGVLIVVILAGIVAYYFFFRHKSSFRSTPPGEGF